MRGVLASLLWLSVGVAVLACARPAPTHTAVPLPGGGSDAAAQPNSTMPVVAATDTAAAQSEGMSSDSERYVIVPGESELRYEVNEVLLREGNRLATAIGVTSLVSGEVLIDRRVPANSRIGPIEADISAFQSDAARRDNAIRERWLESATYPMVRFEPTDVTGAPATFSDGQDVSLTVTGNATVRDTTKPLTFEVSGTIQGDELRASGSATARMTDFNFPPPDILGVLKVDDEFRIVFDILARREG